ncbi:hypothetical protein QH494_27790 [Sphingomonas sp. AR_OL41]|uniref:beta strand repeat-containing protein n=1 Tax=Sphingomonas sp. AR_OL41 TaxID=3042729 RepID=UPI0024813A88|nr:hypothetical protein [Sphingomonas sp. AR_OL41]MDH7975997.1 hypothetical protein [Sphingomonas sp. AR_OL41]
MSPYPFPRRRRRSHLLAGAAVALVSLLAGPAAAQRIEATASRAAIDQQTTQGVGSRAEASRAGIGATVDTAQGGTALLADNAVTSTARGNAATTALTSDASLAGDRGVPTLLSLDDVVATARADSLVASSQGMTGSPVEASLTGASSGLVGNAAAAARVAVTGNDFDATGVGNLASDTLTLAGNVGGAGIVSLQSGDKRSTVSAGNSGATRLDLGAAQASDLSLSDNRTHALASGNVVSDVLAVTAASLAVPPGAAPAVLVAAPDGAARVDALYADLGAQLLAGQVTATAGAAPAAFALSSRGALDAATAHADGNSLAALADGNRSSRSLDLVAQQIAPADTGGGSGAVAGIAGVQRVLGTDVVATTNGGVAVDVGGGLSGSDVGAAQNVLRAAATGNRADGNLLTVDAGTLDSGPSADRPGAGGTARTGSDGSASTTAAFAVQNVQQLSRGTVSATANGESFLLDIVGSVDRGDLRVADNLAGATATANSAVNDIVARGASLGSSYGLNNSQTVDGDVRAQVGGAGERAGARIAAAAPVADASLLVSGNSLSGSAVGSSASNSLALSGTTIGNAGGSDAAVAGALDDGYGAAADVALANFQKLGQPLAPGGGSSLSSVLSDVIGKFAIGGDAPTDGSMLAIAGNSQRASAVGNTALDRVSLGATSLPDGDVSVARTALASSQYGEARVGANTDMVVGARGGVTDATVSIRGNTNQAIAAINDVDNGLAVTAVQLGKAPDAPAHAEVSSLGAATIIGDHVLSSTQFATGTVGASARSTLANSDADAAISGSSFAIGDNATVADVSANRAVNAVSVSGIAGAGNAGLANSQMSAAAVTATATVRAMLALAGNPGGAAIDRSSASIEANLTQATARGNSADNSLDLAAPGATGSSSPVTRSGAFETTAAAPALLVSAQGNDGAVTAAASGSYGTPLNATGSVLASSLGVTGNSLAATAYGNAATNQLTVGGASAAPGALLSNVQTNAGAVSALVTGALSMALTGPLAGSSLLLTGNQLAASATGNLATNTLTGARR